MSTTPTCPSCAAPLRFSTVPAPGSRCKCPRCGVVFSLGGSTPSAVQKVTPSAPPPTSESKGPANKKDEKSTPSTASKKKSSARLVLLTAGAFALLLLIASIGLVFRGKAGKPDSGDSGDSVKSPQQASVIEEPATKKTDPQQKQPISSPLPINQIQPGDGSLPVDVLTRTKAATLYIRVKRREGTASGSGFFEQSSGMVFTNAHVLGMLRATAPPPEKIEVVLNSGLKEEMTFLAKLVAVDRVSDLALLGAQLPPAKANEVARLNVLPAKDLLETQRVYVFGFPYGEGMNKGITASESSVSSMHRGPDGALSKIQINGGSHPGNSGGPVVDTRGNVIGVAVSGIPGTQINFLVPGEQIIALLEGRVTGIRVKNDATLRDGKLAIPVVMQVLDPRKRIARISADYWIGPSQSKYPPSDQPPPQGPDETARKAVELSYDPLTGQATADLLLDTLPRSGQRLWVNNLNLFNCR